MPLQTHIASPRILCPPRSPNYDFSKEESIESNSFSSISVAVPATMCPAMLRKM
jgi:hypothetical protein